MGTTVGVNDRLAIARLHRVNGRIEHRVHQLGVRSGTKCPTHHHAVEAVDHRREVNLSCRDPELRNVGEPLLIRCRRLEVTIEEVVWRRADLPEAGPVAQLTDSGPEALAQFDVELDGSDSVFVRIHELSLGSPSF